MEKNESIFNNQHPQDMYVAFIDILEFGQRVKQDFDEAMTIYQDILSSSEILQGMRKGVNIRVYSDAFLVTSEMLGPMIGIIQGLCWRALKHDCLVRGGIGFGRHIEISDDKNLFVVSQPLVQAVEVEKSINFPCVAFHENIQIPSAWWEPKESPIERGIAQFNQIRMVLPFNKFWFQSAMTRVAMMLDESPEHSEKYNWFLNLYDAVNRGEHLIPDASE